MRTNERNCFTFRLLYITILYYLECSSPLGVKDGKINNSQITTTGVFRSSYGWQARLNKNISNGGAWCADTGGGVKNEKNYDQYIMIDLLNLTKITGIATQGRQFQNGSEWVKDYELSYSRDGTRWEFYTEQVNPVKVI